MSDQQAPAPDAPKQPKLSQEEIVARQAAIEPILHAVSLLAKVAGAQDSMQEAKDGASAVLQLAQAAVILDPRLVAPGGVPADALHPPKPMIPMDKKAPSARKPAA